jgi:CheY-like chemotaxis protein
MRPGPARRAAAEHLRAAGYRVRAAREPYEGTARFVQRPSDLVVLSLAGFRRRDTAFVTTAKGHAPATRMIVLVPSGRREDAQAALRAGADACLPDPCTPAELTALASALRPAPAVAAAAAEPEAPALGRLASEVAHAINNPLQILALVGEDAEVPDRTRGALAAEIGRIREVMAILGRFGQLGEPRSGREPVGPALRQSLQAAGEAGDVEPAGPEAEDGPPLDLDRAQAGVAFDSLLQFLAARAEARPVPVRARVRALPAGRPDHVEAAVRGDGVQMAREALAAAREAVLLNRDDTRQPYPGLALAGAVARGHGGRLLARPTSGGLLLGLRLPLGTKRSG